MLSSAVRLGFCGWGAATFLLLQVHAATSSIAAVVLAIAIAAGTLRATIDLSRRPSAVEIALLALAAAWLAAALTGLDASRSLALSMPLLLTLLLVPAIGRETDATHAIDACLAALCALATWWSADLLWRSAVDPGMPARQVLAGSAPWLVVPNDLAFVGVLWPVWIARMRAAPRIAKWLLAAALLLQFAALCVLHSRLGMLVSGLALAGVVADVGWSRSTVQIAAWVSLWIGSAGLLALLAAPGLSSRSLDARFELWRAGWRLFLEHPLLGIGPHNFVLAYREALDAPLALLDPRVTPWPHNLGVELLAETGVIGCMVFGALIACAARAGAGRLRASGVAAAVLPGIVLCMLEASTLRIWFWVLLAVAVGAANRTGKQGTCKPEQERARDPAYGAAHS